MRLWRIPLSLRCLLASLVVVFFSLAAVMATSTSSRAQVEPKRVLILHSLGFRFKPWTVYTEVIRGEISRKLREEFDFHDRALLNVRVDRDPSEEPLAEYLKASYAKRAPDLIITNAVAAAAFVGRHRERLFPDVPMLLTGLATRRAQRLKLTENDTIVAVDSDHRAALENILRVLPLTKTIKIVSGVSPAETTWRNELKLEFAPLAARVDIQWYNELSFEEILKDAASLPPHTAIYWHLMSVDAAGVAHEESSAFSRLAAASNAPIFAHSDAFLGEGIVGGPMQLAEEVGGATAGIAVRILNGEKAGEITTTPITFAAPRYDWRQVQRWGIRESDLPPGSTVLSKPPPVWETYRWQLVTVITALLLQGALITLLLERHRRQAAELESRQRMVELAHVNCFSTAGEMAAGIAHEINQPLGAILNNTETAKILLESQSPDLKQIEEIVHDIQRDNSRATDVVRTLRSFIKKVPFKKNAIDVNDQVAETLKFLAPEARSREVALGSKLNGAPLRINGDAIQLQQVLSNLILNGFDATSEAQSEKAVTVATRRNGRFAEISVADTGPGVSEEAAKKIFDPFFSTKDHGMGMGLSIVRTIVEAHNGQIEVDNRNGTKGAVFRVKLPLA